MSNDDSDFQELERERPARRSNHDLHVRVALLEQSTTQVKQELHDINKNISKLVWAVITAVLVGILNMVIGQKDLRDVKIGTGLQHEVGVVTDTFVFVDSSTLSRQGSYSLQVASTR